MSRLEQATRRLQSAIDKLDRAVTARAAASGGGDAELRAALHQAEQENARLQRVNGQASERLDAAIGRLKGVLED
jgi:hypothetical protein